MALGVLVAVVEVAGADPRPAAGRDSHGVNAVASSMYSSKRHLLLATMPGEIPACFAEKLNGFCPVPVTSWGSARVWALLRKSSGCSCQLFSLGLKDCTKSKAKQRPSTRGTTKGKCKKKRGMHSSQTCHECMRRRDMPDAFSTGLPNHCTW